MSSFQRLLQSAILSRLHQPESELVLPHANRLYLAPDEQRAKVLFIAHCDSVNPARYEAPGFTPGFTSPLSRPPILGDIQSPALDDRAGVAIGLDILQNRYRLPIDVLLTTDEEIGRSTAEGFSTLPYNWVCSFDRRGQDAVTYWRTSPLWELVIEQSGLALGFGSFSDISVVGQRQAEPPVRKRKSKKSKKSATPPPPPDPVLCGVNVGTGYYLEHSTSCHLILSHTSRQIGYFLKFFEANSETLFEVEERVEDYSMDYSLGWFETEALKDHKAFLASYWPNNEEDNEKTRPWF